MTRNFILGISLIIAGAASAFYLMDALWGDWKAFVALVLYGGAISSWKEIKKMIENDKH